MIMPTISLMNSVFDKRLVGNDLVGILRDSQ